jgi:hypothetical protein
MYVERNPAGGYNECEGNNLRLFYGLYDNNGNFDMHCYCTEQCIKCKYLQNKTKKNSTYNTYVNLPYTK